MADLIYSNLVSSDIRSQFLDKVRAISSRLKIDPNWLMQVMKSESGLNPKAQNKQDGRVVATGLIQFMSPTAAGLGTSLSELYNMSALQQLDYVEKYYRPYTGKMKSYFDVYLVTFFPAAIGKPDNWVLQTSGLSASTIARQNPGINLNKDAQITVGEFKQYVLNTIPAQFKNMLALVKKKPVTAIAVVAASALIGYGLFLYFNRKKLA